MRREPSDLARILLEKARQDEAAVHALLESSDVADEIVAFHAQQAAEKALKAVLAFRGAKYPRTHNLGALLDLLRDAGVDVPEWTEQARTLTPFAVALRYEDLAGPAEPFDRAEAFELIRRVRAWAEELVARG